MTGPVDGTPSFLNDLSVVECATFVAGPSSGMTLAALGAEVIRVDLPGGGSDAGRWPLSGSGASLYWHGLNKRKKSVALDYRTPRGRELLTALATRSGDGAGIYVDNVVGRHRIRHQELARHREDVISLHVDGFADGRPAVDYTANASVGVADMTGPASSLDPVNHVLPAWDLLCGLHAATGILSALHGRKLTGEGADLSIALYDVALTAVGSLGWLEEAREQQHPRPRHGNHVFGSFGTDFPTADGKRIMIVALTEGQWDALITATSTEPVFAALEKALDVDLHVEASRYLLRDTIASVLRPWFEARTLDELSSILDDARVLWARYRSVLEAAREAEEDPTSPARLITQPGVGEILATALPLRVAGSGLEPAPAPRIGADTEQTLGEVLRLDSHEIGRLVDDGIAGTA